MRRAARMDPDVRAGPGEAPGRARVVEVDVRDEDVLDVLGPRTVPREGGDEVRPRGVGAGLDEGEAAAGLDEIGGDRLATEELEVEGVDLHQGAIAAATGTPGPFFLSPACFAGGSGRANGRGAPCGRSSLRTISPFGA